MKRASPTTYKIGSIGEFAAWTKRVVRDPQTARDVPKRWFDSEATAQVSAEAMVKLLSPGNLLVLDAINRHRPASLRELAALTGRKEASLSRTLKRLAQAGIVAFEDGARGTRVPAVIADRVHIEIDLTGHHSAIAVDPRCWSEPASKT
jgi:predicted transcriptional regulator